MVLHEGPDIESPGRGALPIAGSGPGSAAIPSGEGIGLSIVKRLCELLDATLELETAAGHGTRIKVTFPVRCTPESKTRA